MSSRYAAANPPDTITRMSPAKANDAYATKRKSRKKRLLRILFDWSSIILLTRFCFRPVYSRQARVVELRYFGGLPVEEPTPKISRDRLSGVSFPLPSLASAHVMPPI